MYNLAAAAVMILLFAFGMARFILALSSELSEEGMIWELNGATSVGPRKCYRGRGSFGVDEESHSVLLWPIFGWRVSLR